MTNQSNRSRRFLPTTLSLKDVLVIVTAAVSAATPFFTFDAKFDAMQEKYEIVQSNDTAMAERNEKLTEQVIFLTTRIQVLEDSARVSREDRLRLNQKVFELETRLNQRQRR